MHFYLTLLVKMSVTLPTPSAPLSPSPSPNGNINSKRDSEEPWHVSTLFDSFCFWLTEIGNKQRPSQVLSVGTYLSNIFALNCMYLCCFSWYVHISLTMEKKECRRHITIGMRPCFLLYLQQDVALHGDWNLTVCIIICHSWSTAHTWNNHIWPTARLGVCSNGIRRGQMRLWEGCFRVY